MLQYWRCEDCGWINCGERSGCTGCQVIGGALMEMGQVTYENVGELVARLIAMIEAQRTQQEGAK